MYVTNLLLFHDCNYAENTNKQKQAFRHLN